MTKNWIEETKQDTSSSWESGNTPDAKNNGIMGRPKKSKAEKRRPRFTMNLNDHEFDLISTVCENDGVPVAQFMRQLAIKEAKRLSST